MTTLKTLLCLVALPVTLTTNAFADTHHSIDASELQVPATAKSQVHLTLPPGETRIVAAEDNNLTARLTVHCEHESSACERFAEKSKLKLEIKGDQILLSFDSPRDHPHNTHFDTTIAVPRVQELEADMSAGELQIDPVETCTRANLNAGELRFRGAARLYQSASLYANVGDVSLQTTEGTTDYRRANLVGAKAGWQNGKGQCELQLHVNAGEANARLD